MSMDRGVYIFSIMGTDRGIHIGSIVGWIEIFMEPVCWARVEWSK